MQRYTKFQKYLSFILIFSILFTFTIDLSFFGFVGKIFASDSKSYNLVAIFVQEDVYSGVKSKVKRYAEDVAGVLSDAKTMVIPVPNDASPKDIVDFSQRLYTSGYAGIDGMVGDSKLVGSLFVGNIPLPVVQNSNSTSKTVYPYVDFVDKLYTYNETKKIFELNSDISGDPKAEIWHGFISPNTGDNDEDIQKINDYFDKNHDYYIGSGNFKNANNVTNGVQDEDYSSSYEPFVFYYDQVREFNALTYKDYKAYKLGLSYVEDLIYSRYSKSLASIMKSSYNSSQTTSLSSLSTIFGSGVDISSAGSSIDSSNVPDIQLASVINTYAKKFIQIFNGDSIGEFRKYIYNAGRYNVSSDNVSVDLIPYVVSNLDTFSQNVLKNVNNDLETQIDSIVKNGLSRNIALPTSMTVGESSCNSTTYTNFLFGKQASTISQASDCSIYRGSLTNSGNLVQTNRGFNINNIQSDINLCKTNTSGYWAGNSPVNLNMTQASSQNYVLNNSNVNKSIVSLYDIAGTMPETDEGNTASPLNCLDNNFIVSNTKELVETGGGDNSTSTCKTTFNLPINGTSATNWSCSSTNSNYNFSKTFDDIYTSFDSKTSNSSCVEDVVKLGTKTIKTVSPSCGTNVNDGTTQTPTVNSYSYKIIPSYLKHTSPTTQELSGQVASMITKALPTDRNRYIDFISANNTYTKLNYPYLFRVKLDSDNNIDIDNAKTVLKTYLDAKSKEINDIISSNSPSGLTGANKEIYDLLTTGSYPKSNIDLYSFLSNKSTTQVTLNGETKSVKYLDTLAFAIYWNNLTSVSSKYKFILQNYLSDNYQKTDYSFFLPKNRQSYEIAYLGAPGDSENMYVKMDPEQKGENPYVDILTQNENLDNSLLNLNVSTTSSSNSSNKCSPPSGVPIWEWLPAVTCRIKDMLPPKINVTDGSCGASLSSFMGYGYLDEDRDGINDYYEMDLNGGSLSFESDSKKYYYNKTGILQAQVLTKDGERLTLDNSSKISFELVKVEGINDDNSKTVVYDKDYPVSETQDKDVTKYVGFKDLDETVTNGLAKYVFTTKAKDADILLRASMKVEDNSGNEYFYNEQYLTVKVRGDIIYMGSNKLYNSNGKLTLDSSLSSVTASEKTNIYLATQYNLNNLNSNLENLNSYSTSKDKLFLSIVNLDKKGNVLGIDYPLTLKVVDAKSNLILNKKIDNLTGIFSLGEFKISGKYTFTITDGNNNKIEKSVEVMPDTATKIEPVLGTSLMEKGGVITTNVFSIYDRFNNPATAKSYTVKVGISGGSVAFEDGSNSKTFTVLDAYKAFRLKSTNSTGVSDITFELLDGTTSIQKITKSIKVVDKVNFDVSGDFSNIKVGKNTYNYKVLVTKDGDFDFSARAYLISDNVYYKSLESYIDITNNNGSGSFITTTKAGESVKLEFRVEGIKDPVYKTINIYPDLPIKVDLTLSKSKMEASTGSTSVLTASLKDRYGNIAWNDNTSKLNYEVHKNYTGIISPEVASKTVLKGTTTFSLKATNIPGTAFFKVTASPDLTQNQITVSSKDFFSKSDLKSLGLYDNGDLTSLAKSVFSVIDDNNYKFAYSSYEAFAGSLDFAKFSTAQKKYIQNYFDTIKTIKIAGVSANVGKIETYFYYNKDSISSNYYNGIYTTLLGSSYGDITTKDYLAGSMIFDKDNKSLAVTTLLNDSINKTDILNINPNGNLLLNANSSNLAQDIKTYFKVDDKNNFSITFQNETLGEIVSKVNYNFTSNNLILSRCLSSNTNDCFDTNKTSVVLKAIKTGYKTEYSNGTLKLYDDSSSKLLEIDENGKIITNSSYLTYAINSNYTKGLVLNLKINGEIVGHFGISLKNGQLNFLRDQSLISNVTASQTRGGMIVYLEEKNYAYTKQFSGNSTTSDVGYEVFYNDTLTTTKTTLDKFSKFFDYGYENFYSEGGLGWEGSNKTLLDFAAGSNVGESTKNYQTFSLINIGDPVISLKQTKKQLGSTTTTRNFDSTIGKAISLDKDNVSYAVGDFNGDKVQDVIILKSSGKIELLTGKGLLEFNDEGVIAQVSDFGDDTTIQAGDFDGNGFDDFVVVNDKQRPVLFNNDNKKFTRYDIKSSIVLKGTLSQLIAKDMDLDGKADIVTLDDSGEINIFYGTSTVAKFDKKFVSGGHGIELSSDIRNDNGAVYYKGLYQLPSSGSNEYITSSSDLYSQIQKNVAKMSNSATASGSTDINENLMNNLIFSQVNYSTGTSYYDSTISDLKQNLIKAIPSSTSSELGSSLTTAKQDFEYLLNNTLSTADSGSVIYSNANTSALTTFIKSEYSAYDSIKVEKNFVNLTNQNSNILRGGDKVRLTIKLTNTSASTKTNIAYLDKVPTPFKLASNPNFALYVGNEVFTGSDLTIKNSPSTEYTFLLDSYIRGTNLNKINLYPGESITLTADLDTNYFTYGYITAGNYDKTNAELDIIFKPDYRSCGTKYDEYVSKGSRNYEASTQSLVCGDELPDEVTKNATDTDNNNIPDYIDELTKTDSSTSSTYANDALSDYYEDTDGDGLPDSRDSTPSFDDNTDFMASLDKLNQSTDEILNGIDIITQGLGCGFGGGSCISSPLNRAPLAPGNDPTLFGNPIGDGLKVNEGLPAFAAMTFMPVPNPSGGCYSVPSVWPPFSSNAASALACNPAGMNGAGGRLGVTNPANFLRIFVTPTITGAVGTAICFGQPAVAGYSNPPGVSPLVPGGNCIVAAKPVVGCKNDGSDGAVYNNIVPTVSGDEYDVYNGNCSSKESSSSLYLGSLASDYLSYKQTGNIDKKSFNEKLSSLVYDGSNQTGLTGIDTNGPLLNIGDSDTSDSSSLSLDLKNLKDGNFSDVVQVSMQRVSAFPDFIMNWVTRQLEEIANKLTDFPTLYVILPDFSNVLDGFSGFTDNLTSSYKSGTEERKSEESSMQSQIDSLEATKKSLKCSDDSISSDTKMSCKEIDVQIGEIKRDKNWGGFQIKSGIDGVYQFLSTLPIINIEPQKVYIDVPWFDEAELDKNLLTWEYTLKQRQDEYARAKQNWNVEQYKCASNPDTQECKFILDSQNLITSLQENIEVLKSYKKLPEQIHEMLSVKEIRMQQILCNIEAISKITSGRISENGQIFKTWVELYVLIKAILKSWQMLFDVFADYQAECYQCKNERQDLMYYIWKLISAAIPTMPVIQFPKWPDIYLDLHNINANLTVQIPEFEYSLRPILLPTLPNLYLPDSPSVTVTLPTLPVLPTITLPTLPALPSLPSVELPNLPPAPTLPKLFSSIEGYLNILKVITKVMCILKTSPFVPEWRAGDQIAYMTERSSFSAFDFLDLSFPQFSLPFVDAIKITSYVNLEYQTDFLVQMAQQAVMPINVFANDIVNYLDIGVGDIDLTNAFPSDVNINVGSDGTVDDNINESIQNGVNGVEDSVDGTVNDINNVKDNLDSYNKTGKQITLWDFTKILALSIGKLYKTIDKQSSENLSLADFKKEISKNINSKSVQSNPKAEGIVKLWNETLNYSYATEDENIKELLQNNQNKFKTVQDIINKEINSNNEMMTNLDKVLTAKSKNKLTSSSTDSKYKEYNKELSVYNQKTLQTLQNVNKEDKELTEIKTQSKELTQKVTTALNDYTKDLKNSLNKTNTTLSKDLLSYVEKTNQLAQNNTNSDDIKKSLVALNTTTTSTSSSSGSGSCSDSKYGYNYTGLYIVQTVLGKKVTYRLFDYLDDLTGKEIINQVDMDGDSDADALYMVGNELYIKQNVKSKAVVSHYSGGPIMLDDLTNYTSQTYSKINGLNQASIKSGYVNLNFAASTNSEINNYNLEMYDTYDKFRDNFNGNSSSYIPTNAKKVVVDAFSDIDNNSIDLNNSNAHVTTRNTLARIESIGNLAGLRLTTKKVKNIVDDLKNNLLVLVNADSRVYATTSDVKIEYYYYTNKAKTTYSIKIPSGKNIAFKKDVIITSSSNDAYVFDNSNVVLSQNEIATYLNKPLSSDAFIESDGVDSNYSQATPFIKIRYYDNTYRDLDFKEVIRYSIYDLQDSSSDYSITSKVPNGNYYARIRGFKDNKYSSYSEQVALTPQKQADKKAPDISNFSIGVPVFEQKTIDITDYINEDSGFDNIEDVYVDFDLSKDSSGDGITYNDIDYSLETKSNNFLITNSSGKIKVKVGPYNTLAKRKIRIFAIDENENLGYKDITFEVYAQKPYINDISATNSISGYVDGKSEDQPVSFYRIRGGSLERLYDKNGLGVVKTDSNGNYTFNLIQSNKGLELKYTQNGNTSVIARVNETTGKIDLDQTAKVGLNLSLQVIPSNSVNNTEAYPKQVIYKSGIPIFYQYLVTPKTGQVYVEDDFANVKNVGTHFILNNSNDYSYFAMPLNIARNPGDLFVYSKTDSSKTPIFKIFKDGRINISDTSKFSINYSTYGDYVVYDLVSLSTNTSIAKVMIIPESSYILK